MKAWFIMVTALVLLAACDQSAQDNTALTENSPVSQKGFNEKEIDSILDGYKNRENFMGSVAILKDGIPVYSYVSGYSDYESEKLSSTDTKYRIGSISKSFTALLALMAVEEGKLSLTQTLEKFYPAIPNAEKITIEHMLNHRSGIHSYTRDPNFMQFLKNGVTVDEMTKTITSYPSDFMPGTKEAYSNSNAYLLTLILEGTYQQPYAKLIESKITEPLSLKNTYYAEELSASRDEAYSYHNKSTVKRAEEADHSAMLGAGGLVSTPTDLVKFYDAVFSGKMLHGDTLSKMLAIDDTFGLGVQKFTYAGKTSFGHRGRVDEFNSIALYNPEERISLAIIDNSSFSEMPTIAKDLLNAYFKENNVSISIETLEKFVGTYKSVKGPDDHDTVFEREGDKLILVIAGEFREVLIYKGNNTFLFDQSYAPAITFIFSEDGKKFKYEQESEYRYIKQN